MDSFHQKSIENSKKEKDSNPYGFCKWEKIPKENPQGTNCPEYLLEALFSGLLK